MNVTTEQLNHLTRGHGLISLNLMIPTYPVFFEKNRESITIDFFYETEFECKLSNLLFHAKTYITRTQLSDNVSV